MRLLSAGASVKVLPRKIAISILLLLSFAIARGGTGSGESRLASGVGANCCRRQEGRRGVSVG